MTLGSVSPLPDTVFADSERYLGVTLAGSTEMIPFTRIAHMLFFPVTRAYMGSEFGFVRGTKDW